MKNLMRTLGILGILILISSVKSALATVHIGGYEIIDSRRVSRTVYEYTCLVTATNDGESDLEVAAIATSTADHTVVVAGDLLFGAVSAGDSVTSEEHLIITHDRRHPLEWSVLSWEVTATPEEVETDSDGDGLPDEWEREHFGSLDQTGEDDPDGDGLSNLDEHLAETDPITPTDYIRPGDSIQSAIDAAAAGTTVLVGPGTYILPAPLDFGGKAMALKSIRGAEETILRDHGFTFTAGETRATVVDGFTLKEIQGGEGGAVRIDRASPTIIGCHFDDNSGLFAGAIYVTGSAPLITKCRFEGNNRPVRFYEAEVALVNCMFNQNVGTPVTVSKSTGNIVNCTINDKSTLLHNDDAEVTVINSILRSSGSPYGTISYYRPFAHKWATFVHCNVYGSEVNGQGTWLRAFGHNGGGNFDLDPLFVTADDLHLQPTSPCIYRGTKMGAPDDDIDGEVRQRPDNVDIGADEVYGEDGETPPLIRYFSSSQPHAYTCAGVVLKWEVRYAESVRIEPGVGDDLPATGTIRVYPTETTTYRLIARNGDQEVEKELIVPLIGLEDTDGDGIIDGIEICACTDPQDPDSDADGLVDGVEDADHDGEVDPGETHPCQADTDGDGMPDGWESDNGLDPLADDAQEDLDGDGFTNLVEYKGGADPGSTASYPKVTQFSFDQNGSMTSFRRRIP